MIDGKILRLPEHDVPAGVDGDKALVRGRPLHCAGVLRADTERRLIAREIADGIGRDPEVLISDGYGALIGIFLTLRRNIGGRNGDRGGRFLIQPDGDFAARGASLNGNNRVVRGLPGDAVRFRFLHARK